MSGVDDEAGIYATDSEYLDRAVQLGLAGEKLISVSFPEAVPEDAAADHPLLERIAAYLQGEADDFRDVDVGLTVPTDQRSVLEAVREIPHGENASVEQVVRMTPGLEADDQESAATVREALAANPVPLVVPDHRVRDGPSGAPPPVEQRLRSLEGL